MTDHVTCVQVDHLRSIIHFRFGMGFIDSMVANCKIIHKFILDQNCSLYQHFHQDFESILFSLDMAAVVGYLAISRPFLDLSHPRHRNSTHKELLTVIIFTVKLNVILKLK